MSDPVAPGTVIPFPIEQALYQDIDPNCVTFAWAAREQGMTDFHFHVEYQRSDDGNLSADFHYTAWSPRARRGLRATVPGTYAVLYRQADTASNRIVPTLEGQALFHPPGCPSDHQERVIAAHLLAYFRGLGSWWKRGRFRFRATFALDGSVFARPGRLGLALIARGRRGSPLHPDDPEILEYLLDYFEKRNPSCPRPPGPRLVKR